MAFLPCSARNASVSVSRRLYNSASIQLGATHMPSQPRLRPLVRSAPFQCLMTQQRSSSFLNDNSTATNTRSGKDTSRGNYAATKRLGKGKRSKISTLAADHLARADIYGYEDESSLQQLGGRIKEQGSSKDHTASRTSRRRLVLVSSLIVFILVGRDILEVVVPGSIGLILYVASSIKSGLRWLKSDQKQDP